MAAIGGPNAVTNGLVLELDAANQKSYGPLYVEALVVAGGGGGGTNGSGNDISGGGGGGGGILYGSAMPVIARTAYTVTVGAGGTTAQNTVPVIGGNSVFSTLTAIGGGRGGGYAAAAYYAASTGGSGGGGNYSLNAGAAGTAGQGYAGGVGTNSPVPGCYAAGGGGGGGGNGQDQNGAGKGGNGGNGLTFSISGIPTYYSGGGGGGTGYQNQAYRIAGTGGVGGGGNGSDTANGTAGTANSGGGGGGAGNAGGSPYSNGYGGAGGSGIIVIRYRGAKKATGGTITTVGGDTVHTFTTSGTFTTGANWGDGSGNNITGTLTNGPTYSSANGGSIVLNGSTQYIDLGGDITFKATGGWTVESWVNLSAVVGGNLYNFIGASATTYNSWYWTIYNSKLALWNISPGGWYYGSTTILPTTWYHCTLVCNDAGTGYQMYLNGVAEGGTHASYSWNASYAGLKIGYIGRGDAPNGRYMYGYYPHFKAYTRALSATEVLQNFNATRGRYGI